MAFDYGGISDVSDTSTTPITAVPFTMAGWVYADTTATLQYAFGIQAAASNQGWRLGFNASSLILQCIGSGTSNTQFAGGASSGSWIHLGMVCSSTTSRIIYKNGSSVATGTSSLTPSSVSLMRIGAGSGSLGSATSFWNGGLSHVSSWTAALTAAEMAELAAGQHPFFVRPSSLASLHLDASTAVTTGDHIGGRSLSAVPAERSQRPAIFFHGGTVGKRSVTAAPPVSSISGMLLMGCGT